jgi:myo-inositol-hexaphosphate 3-phosphohydrolase
MLTLGLGDPARKAVSGQQSAVSRQAMADGAAVATEALGARFLHGLFAVHDRDNTPGDGDREGIDFKLVRVEKLP